MSDPAALLAPEELEALGFEGAQARLEAVTERLESGDVPLAEALDLYRLGLQLRDYCRARLEAAEAVLEKLVDTADGPRLEEQG